MRNDRTDHTAETKSLPWEERRNQITANKEINEQEPPNQSKRAEYSGVRKGGDHCIT